MSNESDMETQKKVSNSNVKKSKPDASSLLKGRLEKAVTLLDSKPGKWIPPLTAIVGFAISSLVLSIGLGILIGIVSLIIGFILVGILRRGPWNVEKIIVKACEESNLSKKQVISYLPTRLKNAPDILNFLDAKDFEKQMKSRLIAIDKYVNTILKKTFYVDEKSIRKVISDQINEEEIVELVGENIEILRIQSIHVLCKIISDETQNIISERGKRVSNIMMNNIGSQLDTNTLLQQCIQQANSEMTKQWSRYYAIYAFLGRSLINILKDWEWEEAIDTLMGWPGDLYPFLALAAFLQGYWGEEQNNKDITPKVLAGRVMCWTYHHPDRLKTIEQTVEMAGIHEAAIRDGKVKTYALKKQWHEFAKEIARHANHLKKNEDHKTKAESVLKHCNNL